MNVSKRCFCQCCGKEFTRKTGNQRYCSKECQLKVKKEREYALAREERKLLLVPKECPTCGKIFTPKQRNQKYCSHECMLRMNGQWHKFRNKNGNELVTEVTNDADALGLTYGEYMKSLYKSNGRYA